MRQARKRSIRRLLLGRGSEERHPEGAFGEFQEGCPTWAEGSAEVADTMQRLPAFARRRILTRETNMISQR